MQVIFTRHAKKRARENRIKLETATELLQRAEKVELKRPFENYKISNYGVKQMYIDYYWIDGWLFTTKRHWGKKIIILTISKCKKTHFK